VPNERQRREAERRRLKRQLQRRAEREARRRRFAVIASIVGTLVLIGVVVTVVVWTSNDSSSPGTAQPPGGHVGSSTTPTSPASTTSPATAAAYPCTWTRTTAPAAKQVSVPPTTKPPKTGKVDILVSTTRGPMTFQLDRSLAPCAVESFASLAEQHYYDQTKCHRLTTSGIYVLQCGDPTGTGSGGPGYSFADELSGKEKYTRGVIAMANSGPNTNGSQFFIVYKNTQLPPSYTIFGSVTSGLKIVDKVAAAGTDNANGQGDGHPKLPISLTSVAVVS
jgi:peptidyl-prolyl cis-trans isomerase B (cyclophilin B)